MIKIQEVLNKKDLDQFIKFPWKVYKEDLNWVPPLIFDMKEQLDKKKAPFFEFGEAVFFLCFKNGELVGRITAHINKLHNQRHNAQDGFFGFLEFLDDEEVSRTLLEKAEEWVQNKGMRRLLGPENFCVYDEIGFMVKGWESDHPMPSVLIVYSPAYYPTHLSKLGYQKEVDWYTYEVSVAVEIKDIYFRIKERLRERNNITIRTINMKKFDEETKGVEHIIKNSWSHLWGHFDYTDRQFKVVSKGLKWLVDPKVCFFAEKDGEIIGASACLVDVMESVRRMNGRLFPFGWMQMLTAKKKAKALRLFLLGVLGKYRNLGVDVLLYLESVHAAREAGYVYGECSLILENNQPMRNAIEKFGGRHIKTHRIFSKNL